MGPPKKPESAKKQKPEVAEETGLESKASARKIQAQDQQLASESFTVPTQKIAPTVSEAPESGQLAAVALEVPTLPEKNEQARRMSALSVMQQVTKYVSRCSFQLDL